jgi:hypothetical protein
MASGSCFGLFDDDEFWPLLEELVRRSSVETRRAVYTGDGFSPDDGFSAADDLVKAALEESTDAWTNELIIDARHRRLLYELLASGAPVLPQHAPFALQIVASFGPDAGPELAARRSESRRWRAHDDLVGLALDMRDLREAKEGLDSRQARVEALTQELRELGAGSGTDESESESSSGDESSEHSSSNESNSAGESEGDGEGDGEGKST